MPVPGRGAGAMSGGCAVTAAEGHCGAVGECRRCGLGGGGVAVPRLNGPDDGFLPFTFRSHLV